MKVLFISHRNSDGERADSIYRWLKQRVPEDEIFFDKDGDKSIEIGRAFGDEIRRAADEALLMVVVIGPNWAKEGPIGLLRKYRNRIKEQDDWVRQEIAIAKKHDAEFLTILIDDTKLPQAKDLPAELHWLLGIQTYNLYRDDARFEQGMWKIAAIINKKLHGRYKQLAAAPQVKQPSVFMARDAYGLFTGREDVLARLHAAFNKGDGGRGYVALALSGLGGMGKTQTAIKYAHLYGSEYKTVLWANAATRNQLLRSFKSIATSLNLPEKDYDEPLMIDAVKTWLRDNSGWLLILDNADTPSIVQDFLPRPNGGHTLLTTRNPATERIADPIKIESMNDDEGAHFLLSRANIPEPTANDQRYARYIVKEMGGLPLGIEQAGAYIARASSSVERRQQRLSTYLDDFRTKRAELLREGKPSDDVYAYTVATTWRLFTQRSKEDSSHGDGNPHRPTIEDAHPAAIDLLCMCAFLAPDAIPEELFANGGSNLGSELGPISARSEKLDQVFETLESFSLIQRSFDFTIQQGAFSVHRLVQAVIQDDLAQEVQHVWAERATRAVNRVFPAKDADKKKTWSLCERYLPHALACSELVKTYGIVTPSAVTARAKVHSADATSLVNEVVQLLNQAGTYLRAQSRFADAAALLQQAWNIREDISGPDSIETAKSIDSLARLYFDRYMYRQAKALYTRALAIREAKLGPSDKAVVDTLNRLGLTYWYLGYRDATNEQDRASFYDQAGQLLDDALSISQQLLGPENSLTLNIRNNRALLYRSLQEFALAITVNQEVLASREARVKQARSGNTETDSLEPLEQEVAQSQQNLAVTFYQQQQASSYADVAKYAEAENLLKKVLAFRLKQYANQPYHFQIARCQRYLALVHMAQDKDWEAKAEFEQALEIWGKSLDNPAEVLEAREEYASLLDKMGLRKEAEKIRKEIERLRNGEEQA